MTDIEHAASPGVNLAIIGLRGSGKSTLGAGLAKQCDFVFVDTDDIVLDRFQEPTFVDVMRVHGEAAWRQSETAVARELLEGSGQLISMGGGMPIIPEIQLLMQEAREEGTLIVVYLDTPIVLLQQRLAAQPGDRSTLTGMGLIEEIETIAVDRDPVYRAMSDIIFAVQDEPIPDTLQRIAKVVVGEG
ncbi:MAG: shikimate kinase [Phycisphaerales bacterium]|nr:shikimate kinase [Phycisphaerales bacterium]